MNTKRNLICEVLEGQIGDWKVERFEVSEEEAKFGALNAVISTSAIGRGNCTPGTYTELTYKGSMIMSDTEDEMRDFSYFVRRAKGAVLVNGLGLGMTVEALLRKKEVEKVVVVEISKEVINLVGDHYLKKWGKERLEIYLGNALEWKNPMKYKFNAVWHDIWDTICADNLPEMKKLHRKCGHWLAPGGFQESWSRDYCELAERRY